MPDVTIKLPPGEWTDLNRGATEVVSMENVCYEGVRFLTRTTMPTNPKEPGRFLPPMDGKTESVREPNGFAPGDKLFARPEGAVEATIVIWRD
jgi:hypothetical protein